MLQNMKENFKSLGDRITSINSNHDNVNAMREMIYSLDIEKKPTLIMATGGSKIVAYYLEMLLERIGPFGIISEVIEPRDYFYKYNRERFSNLICISASGNTNLVSEALEDFEGDKYLICENPKDVDYEVISWGNDSYDKEHSFISLASSLGPITMMLDTTGLGCLNLGISNQELAENNKKVIELLNRSQEKIENIPYSFKDVDTVQIIGGHDTKCSNQVLESNLVEAGLCNPIIHDKGSICHGRTNLLNKENNIVYLSHDKNSYDKYLINILSEFYPNIIDFNTSDLSDESYFWREYYLMLQMYYLSKKIAEDKEMDLTKPIYNKQIIKSLYNYRGIL